MCENNMKNSLENKRGTDLKNMNDSDPGKSVISLKETAKEWARKVGIDSVDKLNAMIDSGHSMELVLVCEAMQSNCIYEIARRIVSEKRRIILISGPSSAGKTTLSHRLGIQLMSMGLKPHAIAADNYFVNREDNPKDENGNYDFECLEAMDLEKLNTDMCRLLSGEKVELPVFNFKTGEREYHGNYLKIADSDVIIMEGIHSLNPAMTYMLDDTDKYKIYISPLNQLYIDTYDGQQMDSRSKVSTMDSRLLRRMVRDYRTRGNGVEKTLSMWKSVRNGEEKYIFPYEKEADVMFNSGLLYEYTAVGRAARPLLQDVEKQSEYYDEAQRLLTFVDMFRDIDTGFIPANSILREFIGGGCFNI